MKIPFLLFFLLLLSCRSVQEFKNKEVCFLLFNLNTGTFEKIVDRSRCEEKLPSASTFKVPLAVIAFDSGVLKNSNSSLKWDGKKRFLEVWNKDHSAQSWMKYSVVWFSQKLTPLIGRNKIENYLKSFEFGNADMSGGLKHAWLTPAPTVDKSIQNSLKISGFEQVHFLKKLWRGELEASREAQKKARNLLPEEASPKGFKLSGKTGSGLVGENHDLRVGWWVGYLEAGKKKYVVVINFTDKQKLPEKKFGGQEAKDLAKQLLAEKNLW